MMEIENGRGIRVNVSWPKLLLTLTGLVAGLVASSVSLGVYFGERGERFQKAAVTVPLNTQRAFENRDSINELKVLVQQNKLKVDGHIEEFRDFRADTRRQLGEILKEVRQKNGGHGP